VEILDPCTLSPTALGHAILLQSLQEVFRWGKKLIAGYPPTTSIIPE
jgi:hypothetical protein